MIIMSGVSELALAQVLHCKSSFEALGYDVIICEGLKTSEQPPAGSGCRTSVTWGAVALPKIVSLLERQGAGRSDLFILCEDSCQPTKECAPVHLTALVRPEENVWFGAVHCFEKRKITSVISEDWNVINETSEVMAPAGSKIFVCGIEFLKMWVDLYKITPTAWHVDYYNQVLVASGLLRVHHPFIAGQLYPHYSHRQDSWGDGSDTKIVPLVSAGMMVAVYVVVMEDYFPEPDCGYLQVETGDIVQLTSLMIYRGDMTNLYSLYAYGRQSTGLCESGWFPLDVLQDVRTQLQIFGASII